MFHQILIAFDHFGPAWPFINNQNFNVIFKKIVQDVDRTEMFTAIKRYRLCPSLLVEKNDLFIYPLWVGFHDESWLAENTIDVLASTCIKPEMLDSIRYRNGYLLIDVGHESVIRDNVISMMHDYFKGENIPLNKVILQTGNVNGKELYQDYCYRNNIASDAGMKISCFEHFEWRASAYLTQSKNARPQNINYGNIQKTFLCLNRNYRWHRINLFLLWHRFDLIDSSHFSMNEKCINSGKLWKDLVDLNLIKRFSFTPEHINLIQDVLPIKFDDLTEAWPMAQLFGETDHLYDSSLISVVTETNYESEDIFNTEKIFKPIAHRHPFIMVGPYKTLEKLKSMGYKTFSDFWDESYDDIEDPEERLVKIVELCREIDKWSTEEKKIFFYKVMSVTKHNYELLKSLYPNNMRRNFWHEFRDANIF